MSSKIVVCENVGKQYWIQHNDTWDNTLREALMRQITYWGGRILGKEQAPPSLGEEFWALQDLSFSIERGKAIGILGRNGAGKSTLLKLLSHITLPTTGRILLSGKVSSLLEVGVGFHAELTARENIYFNGALLGMQKREIQKNFDSIVDFSGVEQFLDTPMKRFSSGMCARLGFAIGAHLYSDLFIVDEVLAVGDAAFQQKCLQKMRSLVQEGRTLLFVSHDVQSLLALCDEGIFLEKGRLISQEPIAQCVSRYLDANSSIGLSWRGDAGDAHIQIHGAELAPPSLGTDFFTEGDRTALTLDCTIHTPKDNLVLAARILNRQQQTVAFTRINDSETLPALSAGRHTFSLALDLAHFQPGEYFVSIEASLHPTKAIVRDQVLLRYVLSPPADEGLPRTDGAISLGNPWTCSTQITQDIPSIVSSVK